MKVQVRTDSVDGLVSALSQARRSGMPIYRLPSLKWNSLVSSIVILRVQNNKT